MNINELKVIIAEVLEEAKKDTKKADLLKKAGGTARAAYGTYEEAFDFSTPLGPYNLYKSQGAVNWGPMTGPGQHIDQNFANPNTRLNMHEEAIRHVVREVIENGLIPEHSAWSPMLESNKKFESIWDAAMYEAKHYYLQHLDKQENGVPEGGPKKSKIDSTKYGKVAPHGQSDKKGKR